MPSQASSYFSNDGDNDSMEVTDEEPSRPTTQKRSGACVDCKSVKVRCELIPGEKKCRRCQTKNLPCHPRERKKRKPADTHEQLQERSHEQDLRIQNLLHQYDQRIAEQKIHQWVSRVNSTDGSMDVNRNHSWMHKGKSPEMAVMSHFSRPGTQLLLVPEIVKHCSLYPEDIQELFSIYFTRVNPYFSLLDQTYHTPEKLIGTSPFLFTVICAVASRFYSGRPRLYNLAMEFSKDCAAKALIQGDQSIDVCQAYLIMAVYPVPKKRWVEDKSWLLMGMAIRMAMELGLNQPPPPTCDTREALNRMRTWLNCYCVDGSHAIQFGKMPMLQLDDYLARHSRDWYKTSPLNTPFDVHLCAYVQMIIHMAKWRAFLKPNEPREEDQPESLVNAAIQQQDIIAREMEIWVEIYNEEYMYLPLPICNYRSDTSQLIASYLRLCVLAVGFQKTKAEDLRPDSEVLVKCIDAARSVIQMTLDRLFPTGFLRYAMEANFLYMSFASAFLINLFRPRYILLLDHNLQRELIDLVLRLIAILGSDTVALDGRHTPALYSRFLSSLMDKHGISQSGSNSPRTHSRTPSFYNEGRHVSPQGGYVWPDVQHSPDEQGNDFSQGYHLPSSGYHLDFSLSHFIRTVSAHQASPSPSEGENFDRSHPADNWHTQWKSIDTQPPQQQSQHSTPWQPSQPLAPMNTPGLWTHV